VSGISFRDVHGIAEELGVDVQTVRRWIQSGKLRAFKPGKEYRVQQADLEEFLAAREVRPKAPRRSPSEPSFNDVLAEERRRAERETRIEALPGWTRAAVEDEEFVQRFEAAKSSPARARDLVTRQGEETDLIIAQLRDQKERDAPRAELQATRRDLQQARARQTACTFMEVDLWRGKDVADVRPVDILAEVAAAQGDLVAALSGEADDIASEAG
jgi:excisionase family DNA binding protein